MKRSKALKIFWEEIKLVPVVIRNQLGWYDMYEKDKKRYYNKRWGRNSLSSNELKDALKFEEKDLQNRLVKYEKANYTTSTIAYVLILFLISVTILLVLYKNMPYAIFASSIILFSVIFVYSICRIGESKRCAKTLKEINKSFKSLEGKNSLMPDLIELLEEKHQAEIKYNDNLLATLPEIIAIIDISGGFPESELNRKEICDAISKIFKSTSGNYLSSDSIYKRYNHLKNDPALLKKIIANIIDKIKSVDLNAPYK